MGAVFMKKIRPLWDVTRQLSATAAGREPADLVMKDARLVNVCTGEILPHMDVAVRCGRIALVGDAVHCVGEATRVVDAHGQYLTPGFLDGHMHVESSMMTLGEYARATLPHGTTGIFPDPHEIVNVAGLSAMRAMMEDARTTPQHVYMTTPSCVPASPGLENTGGSVTADDIAETMRWDGVAGLGEMMNVHGVVDAEVGVHARIAATLRAGRPVTGHFPLEDNGALLAAYAAAGVSSDHESTRPEDVLAKLRLGMAVMIREGSAWDDLPAVVRAVTEQRIDTRHVLLVSDDLHADTLLSRGHMDYIVQMAVCCGVPPVTAVQMATLNTAEYFGVAQDIGSVTPGRIADFLLLSDLAAVEVHTVYVGGEEVAKDGSLCCQTAAYSYPAELYHTMRLKRKRTPDDFVVHAPQGAASCHVRVMAVRGGSVLTTRQVRKLPVRAGRVCMEPDVDICKVTVLNRHGLDTRGYGFVEGFSLKRGAVASTYAHDAHNLLVMGTNDADMALAANTLIDCGGGLAAVADGKVLARVELPIAGLMSGRSAAETAAALEKLARAWRTLGCELESPFMTFSLLSLAVIPDLRITDKGLVDVRQNRLVPLFVEKS